MAVVYMMVIAIATVTQGVAGKIARSTPLLLRAHEGDKVYIPCRNAPHQPVYSWKIQESLYPVTELPGKLEATENGIIVHHVQSYMGGTYICFSSQEKVIAKVHFDVQAKNLTTVSLEDKGNFEDTQSATGDIYHDAYLKLRVTKTDVVFIPCTPAYALETSTIWSIDNSLYSIYELPQNHFQSDNGIIVSNISSSLNLVRYKCYGQMGEKAIQWLYTVDVELLDFTPLQPPSSEIYKYYTKVYQLKLVSQGVHFNETYYNFEFRVANVSTDTNCSFGITSMLINDNNQELWTATHKKYPPKFSVSADVFNMDTLAVANVLTTYQDNLCALLNYGFRVNEDDSILTTYCTQENFTICIPLPENWSELSLVVIWPRKQDSDEDCVCSLFIPNQYVNFGDCYCFVNRLTDYKVELVDQENKLCWNDLTRTTNLTNVLLARDYLNLDISEYERIFLSQLQIVVQGYNLFPPSVNRTENGTVCIQSNSSSPDDWSPVIETIVVIYDSTNDVILKISSEAGYFCLDLDLQGFTHVCAPFSISATAYTRCTSTHSPTLHYSPGRGNTNYCNCIKAKANISMNVQQVNYDSISVLLYAKCDSSKKFNISHISNLHLIITPLNCNKKVSDCVKSNVSFGLTCNTNTSIDIIQLAASTSYNMSVIWRSPPSIYTSECQVLGTISATTLLEMNHSLELKIGIGIGSGGFIVLVFIIMAGCIIFRCKRNTRNTMSYVAVN